jgi:histidine triad (HIT) family protein
LKPVLFWVIVLQLSLSIINMNEECIFCKIIKGEISNYTVYEDEHSLAFLDIAPRAKGHTVVIPKVHAERVDELPEENIMKLFAGVKKAIEKVNNALSPDGFNVGWNDGKSAGQVVPHLHVHILPRWKGDGGGNMHSIIDNPGDNTVEEISMLFK